MNINHQNKQLRIGILTFHRAHNNGAVLQCYALQEAIGLMGHHVEIIDYQPSHIENRYNYFNTISISILKQPIKFFRYFLRSIKKLPANITKKKQFEVFRQNFLRIGQPKVHHPNDIPQHYDFYIVGSDQVWNSDITGGIDKIYWGDFCIPKHARKISYAASTPYKNLSSMSNERLIQLTKEFDVISVREKNIQEKLQSVTSKHIELVLDPTLILPMNMWENIMTSQYKDEHYIVIYQARVYKKNPYILQEKAKILAKELNCKVIDINNSIDKKSYSPSEFVSLIKHAKYVITSSFHGTAFSIIFNTSFYSVCYDDGNDDRYASLLNNIGLKDQLVSPDFEPKNALIDFTEANKALTLLRNQSLSYLSKALLDEFH